MVCTWTLILHLTIPCDKIPTDFTLTLVFDLLIENFNLDYIFWLVGTRTLTFHLDVCCDKTHRIDLVTLTFVLNYLGKTLTIERRFFFFSFFLFETFRFSLVTIWLATAIGYSAVNLLFILAVHCCSYYIRILFLLPLLLPAQTFTLKSLIKNNLTFLRFHVCQIWYSFFENSFCTVKVTWSMGYSFKISPWRSRFE
jgi:hypothetical protein